MHHINRNKIAAFRTKKNGYNAYDVSVIGKSIGNGQYELEGFDDSGVDYFDGQLDKFIWSIGRRVSDNLIIASLDADLYDNPAYECIWLR